jgi:hypothetical protein
MQEKANQKARRAGVHKRSLANFIVNYYWLFMLVSIVLFFYVERGKPGPIELSFYPMYFLVGAQVKHFLQETVPSFFGELRQTGALPQQALPSSAEKFQGRLQSRLGDILGIVGGLSIVWFHWAEWGALFHSAVLVSSGPLPRTALLIVNVIDVLLAYGAGVAAWKAVLTGFEIRRLGSRELLKIHPFHPDRCAGLGAIGRLCFSLSCILLTISLFLCGWMLYGRWVNPHFFKTYAAWEPWFAGGLIVVTLIGILAFFVPMNTVHRLMKKQAADFEAKLLAVASRISDMEESLVSQVSQLEHETLKAEDERIRFLRDFHARMAKIPSWPIDLQTSVKFVTIQVPLSIGFLDSVLKLWEKVGWNWQ